MSNFWNITLGINRSQNGIDYLDYEDANQNRRFSGNLHTDDLLMMIKEDEKQEVSRLHPSFSKWSNRPSYFLGFVEKIKNNNQIVFRVLPGVVDYLFEGENLNSRIKAKVFIIDSCTTLIREFKMIRLSEFLELSRYLYEPSKPPLYDRLAETNRISKTLSKFYNPSQIDAILTGFKMSQGIFLLQGPPGTGKTHTIRGLLSVLFMKNNRKNRILVCAPSNSAIDEIAKRVADEKLFDINGSRIEDIKLVRIVSQNHNLFDIRESKKPETKEMPDSVKKISLGVQVSNLLNESDSVIELENIKKTKDDLDKVDELLQHYLKNNEDHLKIKELQERKFQLTKISFKQKSSNKKALDKLKEIEQSILNSSNVVFTTLSGAASKELDLPTCEFDFVIIDEACQSVELSSLIPFRYKSRVVILVGDPRQLPSTTFSQDSGKNNYSRSLFERLMQDGCRVKMLEIQYRMVQEISEFPSHYFYQGRLQTHENNDLSLVPSWISTPGVMMMNLLTSRESKKSSDTSLSNTPECEFIGKLFTFLKPVHGNRLNIGIITPYKKQVRIIKEYFQKFYGDHWKNDVEINTVDGFQGREKDVIVFSAVRSAESIGFLADVRRVNVAITRAKFALWVVASKSCLERNECWSSFINYCSSKGKLFDCKDFNEVSEYFDPKSQKKLESSSRPLLETPKNSYQSFQPPPQVPSSDHSKSSLLATPEADSKLESNLPTQASQPSNPKPILKPSHHPSNSSKIQNKSQIFQNPSEKNSSNDASKLFLNIISRK
jgi:predicted DNA helicase